MVEKENKSINTIIELDHAEGIRFAQWAMTTVTTGHDIPESKWQIPQKTPQPPQINFYMEKITEGYHVSPVYGVLENKE